MNSCTDCTYEKSCGWFCPIHGVHHPVQSMVEYCLERATSPIS